MMVLWMEAVLICICAFYISEIVGLSVDVELSPAGPLDSKSSYCRSACHDEYNKPIVIETKPQENPDLSTLEGSCRRGCRFHSIVEYLNKSADHIDTLRGCFENCYDAYLGHTYNNEACRTGCNYQQSYKRQQDNGKILHKEIPSETSEDDSFAVPMFPFILMRNMFSNMASQMSLSFFTIEDEEGHTGRLVVIQSRPQIAVDFAERNGRNFDNFVTHPLASTSLFDGHKQLKSPKGYRGEINDAQAANSYADLQDNQADWLTCLARRTGVPRIFLCVLLLLSALSMIWLCLSAAVTAPSQHVKLSINSGDLEYIRSLPQKKGIYGVYPQATVEARPLPTKIRVEKL